MDNVERRAKELLDAAYQVFMREQKGETPKEVSTAVAGIVSFLKVGLSQEMDDPVESMAPWACKDCG